MLAEREVQGAGLVPGPRIDVDEPNVRLRLAVVVHGAPDRRILRVVVDHHDLHAGVVDRLHGSDRFDQHVGRLVVGGDLQGHHRHVRGIGAEAFPVESPLRFENAERLHRLRRVARAGVNLRLEAHAFPPVRHQDPRLFDRFDGALALSHVGLSHG